MATKQTVSPKAFKAFKPTPATARHLIFLCERHEDSTRICELIIEQAPLICSETFANRFRAKDMFEKLHLLGISKKKLVILFEDVCGRNMSLMFALVHFVVSCENTLRMRTLFQHYTILKKDLHRAIRSRSRVEIDIEFVKKEISGMFPYFHMMGDGLVRMSDALARPKTLRFPGAKIKHQPLAISA